MELRKPLLLKFTDYLCSVATRSLESVFHPNYLDEFTSYDEIPKQKSKEELLEDICSDIKFIANYGLKK